MRRAHIAIATALVLAIGIGVAPVTRPVAVAAGPSRSTLATVDRGVAAAAGLAGPGAALDLVVSLDRVAGTPLQSALAQLGTWSWTFRDVPVAAVRLPVGRLDALRRLPGVRGVHLDRPLKRYLDRSAQSMNTAHAWNDLKITGKGVTVAVLDTGVDGTHPDLAPAMKANIKLVGFGAPTPAVPVEGLPNSDTSSGHGTHVAGDVAGRGVKSAGQYRGMAPGADLVGVGTGDALSVFTVIEGFDWIIANRARYGIDIVTNSWGTDFEPFDPNDPINIASRAVHDAGIVVLFAMGNSYDELTMNPYAVPPWVIPVAAGTKTGGVTDFSSGGLEADTVGTAFPLADVAGETRTPSHMGLYHPAVTSTGADVVSTRAANTVVPGVAALTDATTLSPDRLPWYTTMSGTSMATPETAGVAALVLQADPGLQPDQVRQVLETSARPIACVPFWRQGYGYTDASAAVDLALAVAAAGANGPALLADRHAARDAGVLASLAHPTRTWAFDDPAPLGPGSVAHTVAVPSGAARLKVVSNGPSTPEANFVQWDITVTDANGRAVAATANAVPNFNSGTMVLDIDLHRAAVAYTNLAWGTWTVTVTSSGSPTVPATGVGALGDLPKATVAIVAAVFDALPATCVP